MCEFFSCIVTKDEDIFYSLSSNSHEDLIEEHGLVDNVLANRDFVRIEIEPPYNVFSRNRGDWSIVVDEEDTLPVWFEDNQRRIYEKLYDVLDVVLKTIDYSLSDPRIDPETKPRDQKIDRIRDFNYNIRWQESATKHLSQKQMEFKAAYEIQDSLEDNLFMEISNWFEGHDLYGFFDDWSENAITIAISIKNKTQTIQDLIDKYLVALDKAYELVD